MPPEERRIVSDKQRDVPYTLGLTQALEEGVISPAEYVRLRAGLVGQEDVFQTLLIPLFKQIILKFQNIFSRQK